MPADFWARVDTSGGPDACHPWTGATNANGYGKLAYPTRTTFVYAHRLAFELGVGPIPPGQTVDHRCHNEAPTCVRGPACPHRPCCNIRHLTLRPKVENAREGARTRAACRRGHPWTPETTIWTKSGRRKCRTCANEAQRGRYRDPSARSTGSGSLLRTHCAHGHVLDEANTYRRPDGYRDCRKCRAAAAARSRAKAKGLS